MEVREAEQILIKQIYLDQALAELKGEARSESLWLYCLNAENGNDTLAAARYVTDRARVLQESAKNTANMGSNPNGALSFSAACQVEEREEDAPDHSQYKAKPAPKKWSVIVGVTMLHLVLGVITIDVLRKDKSIVLNYLNASISGKPKPTPHNIKYERFLDVDRGHFRDAATGIVWHRNILPIAEARRMARVNRAYRLPTIFELSSIVDCGDGVARMQLDLIDYRYFKSSRQPHNGQCLEIKKPFVLPKTFGSFSGAVFSKDTLADDSSKVWGINPQDGGARLFEEVNTFGYGLLIKAG